MRPPIYETQLQNFKAANNKSRVCSGINCTMIRSRILITLQRHAVLLPLLIIRIWQEPNVQEYIELASYSLRKGSYFVALEEL